MSQDSERRFDDRLAVAWPADLILDERQIACHVIDVSTAGTKIRLDHPEPLTKGAEAILRLPELGDFAAEVAWLGDTEVGLQIMAGPDLLLKRFAEASGQYPSHAPRSPGDDPPA